MPEGPFLHSSLSEDRQENSLQLFMSMRRYSAVQCVSTLYKRRYKQEHPGLKATPQTLPMVLLFILTCILTDKSDYFFNALVFTLDFHGLFIALL